MSTQLLQLKYDDAIKSIQQGIINSDYSVNSVLVVYYLCHICHIYGICRSKEMGDALKSSFGEATQTTRLDRVILMGKGGLPLCKTAVLKFYCIVSLTGYYKRFYKIHLPYISAVLPVLYLLEICKAKSAS